MSIFAIRKFSSSFPILYKVGKYALGATGIAAGLYAVNKYYPLHEIIHKNFKKLTNFPTNVVQIYRNFTSNIINVNKWTIIDQEGNPIVCELCDQAALEKVRSVYMDRQSNGLVQGTSMEDYLKTWKDKSHVFEKFQKKLKTMVKEYGGIVISAHNMKKIPADGDSLVSMAANLKAVQLEAGVIGRPIQIISSVEHISTYDPKTLYVFCLPVSDDEIGFLEEDRQIISTFRNNLAGSKAGLIVTDVRFPPIDEFADKANPYSFDAIIVQDHHSWTQKMMQNVEKFEGNDNILLMNNHLLFENAPYPDAYSSGAFQADLADIQGNPWFRFLKQAGLFADKYYDQFPRTVHEVNADYAVDVTETLNILGTYIFDWKKEGKDVSAQEKRATLLNLVRTITASSNFTQLDNNIKKLSRQCFGAEFETWKQGVLVDIEDSHRAFLQSTDKIVFYPIKSKDAVTLFVHKRVNTLMDARDEYKDRVLVHYQIDKNGDLDVMIARGKDNNAIDVSILTKNGPDGIPWGGGHANRAGFSTRINNPEDAKKLANWWGTDKNPQKILNYLKANIKI